MNQALGANTTRFAGATAVRTVSAPTLVASAAVLATQAAPVQFQSGWRWCHKCQGLFFSLNNDQGACPSGGHHDSSGSGAYAMAFGNAGPGMQTGWRWCHKCQGLFFSLNSDQGACPTGGRHDNSGSGAYLMTFGDGGPGMQPGWRWCKKCQGLFFSRNSDQGACPAGDRHDASSSGAYEMRFDANPIPTPVLPASLPVVSSQKGNLFADRNDAGLQWYLPDFTLADDVDPRFAFVAMQSGQDAEGNPANRATLTLRMHKSQPDDVVKFSQANPNAKLQEIPLAEMTAILSSFYTDDAGQQQERAFKATIQDEGNGDFLLTFDSILGLSVIGLYLDLTSFGKAVVNLSASYQAWSQPGTLQLLRPTIGVMQLRPLFAMRATAFTTASAVSPALAMRSVSPVTSNAVADPLGDTLTQTRQTWTKPLPLFLKYQQGGYQLKYTVSTATVSDHIIRDVKDLKDFSLSQTEFAELKALDMSKYPTLSRLYIGVISRTIVVIPQRYSVVRGRSGCAATCYALVDSSAADGSACKFEFDFTIAPEVSRIEFLKLSQEIFSRDDLKGYTPKLPDFLRETPPSTLTTQFKSGVTFSAGPDPKTFTVTVSIHADGSQTPAVANANLFIAQLCAGTGTDLGGSLSVKLDDGYPDAVLPAIDLSFVHSAGTDEIAVELEEGSAQIKLTNQSPLDLQISRYALQQASTITEVPGDISLPANGSVSVPLPADHTGLTLAADAQLVVPNPMRKSDITRFLNFQTADVQETQYVVAIHGNGIDFKKVDSVVANITFSTLPGVVPRHLSLNKNVASDSTHIVIPLENAVFSLPGSVNLEVHFVDPGASDLTFTMEHDFTAEPLMIVLQSDIDEHLPQT